MIFFVILNLNLWSHLWRIWCWWNVNQSIPADQKINMAFSTWLVLVDCQRTQMRYLLHGVTPLGSAWNAHFLCNPFQILHFGQTNANMKKLQKQTRGIVWILPENKFNSQPSQESMYPNIFFTAGFIGFRWWPTAFLKGHLWSFGFAIVNTILDF